MCALVVLLSIKDMVKSFPDLRLHHNKTIRFHVNNLMATWTTYVCLDVDWKSST